MHAQLSFLDFLLFSVSSIVHWFSLINFESHPFKCNATRLAFVISILLDLSPQRAEIGYSGWAIVHMINCICQERNYLVINHMLINDVLNPYWCSLALLEIPVYKQLKESRILSSKRSNFHEEVQIWVELN